MCWEIIAKSEIDSWNDKLKQYNAALYQYPYYMSGEYSTFFYKNLFIKYVVEGAVIAYAALIEIGMFPFRAAIIDDGPVILNDQYDLQLILHELKKFAKRRFYIHLQIRPVTVEFQSLLKTDKDFNTQLYFPFHCKENSDWNIYNQPEDKLWASFKVQCRRKIVLAGRVSFTFSKLQEDSLKDVKKLFKQVTKVKGYRYISSSALERIYKKGKKHNLCDFYGAYLNNELVNVVFIIKDTQSFYHFTSALLVKGYKHNESPPAKLHFFIMKDCFYNEHKSYYNISYGGTESLKRFKELFKPVEVKRLPYYTFVISKNVLSVFQKATPENSFKVRRFFKNLSKHIKQFPGSISSSIPFTWLIYTWLN